VANQSVSSSSTDNVASYSVSTSALTSIATATTDLPTGPISVAEDSTGGYLMAVDYNGDPNFQVFTMSSGTLTSVLTGASGTNTDSFGAIAVAALP
jgi:hypothetical protein